MAGVDLGAPIEKQGGDDAEDEAQRDPRGRGVGAVEAAPALLGASGSATMRMVVKVTSANSTPTAKRSSRKPRTGRDR